jgi:hypothetical protein
MNRAKKVTVGSIVLLLSIATGAAAASVANNIEYVVSSDDDTRTKPNYAQNKFGESFGSLSEASVDADAPDLISAVGGNGVQGYLRSSELLLPLPKSPEEALRWQESRPKTRVLKLYAVDGRTIVGEFVSGSGESPVEQ